MTFVVRPAVSADSLEIAALLSQLGYASLAADIRRRLERSLEEPNACVLVAADGAQVVGMGSLHIYSGLTSDRCGALITSLVVHESLQGRGIGRMLIAALETSASSRGCDRLMVTTANHRSGAHAFYEKLGYEFSGRRYARRLTNQ